MAAESPVHDKRPLTVFLIEDHHVMRAALKKLLKFHHIDVIGEASEGITGAQKVLELRPDVAVVDMRLPDVTGLEVTTRIKEQWREAKVLVISACPDFSARESALAAGAASFLAKEKMFEELEPLLRQIAAGESTASLA